MPTASITVTGVTSDGDPIDAGVLLASFGNLGGLAIPQIDVVPYPAGVDSAEAAGDITYVALGDSLAAAVGVEGLADGYVSSSKYVLPSCPFESAMKNSTVRS